MTQIENHHTCGLDCNHTPACCPIANSTGSFPTWDGMRALEERVAALTEQRDILLRDIAGLRVSVGQTGSSTERCSTYDPATDECSCLVPRRGVQP